MIRRLLVYGLLCACNIAIAQNADSLTFSREDSVYVTPSMALPTGALGFVSYQPEPLALENANGMSTLSALYATSPGLTMDGMPFPGSARFRSLSLSLPASIISPTIVWDGIPYRYEDFMPFQLNGFNTGMVSVAGPGGLFGYGPLVNPGGILIDTKLASPHDNWAIEFNTYPTYYQTDDGDHATVFLNNLSLSKGGPNTSVRLFYSQIYQPGQRIGSGKSKTTGNQGGLAFATRFKRLHFSSNILALKYRDERTNILTSVSENIDVTAKGKVVYRVHPVLSLSVLGGYDLNTERMDSETTRKRLFYRASLDFNRTFRNFSVFGSAAYQRDSSSIKNDRYTYSPERAYETNSFIGTLGFSFKNFLWIRSIVQSNKISMVPLTRKLHPSYFVSMDILQGTKRKHGMLSKAVLRINYSDAYNYAHLISLTSQDAGFHTFFNNQASLEAGLDVGFGKTGIAMTYFQQRWHRNNEDCPPFSGPCGFTNDNMQAVSLGGIEIKLDQQMSPAKSVKILLTVGSTLTWQRQQMDNAWSYKSKNTLSFLNTAISVKRFFGNVMVNMEDHYDRWDFADVPVPLREISIGYGMAEINSRYLKSARLSFIGRNLITGEETGYGARIPHRVYVLNFSMKFR